MNDTGNQGTPVRQLVTRPKRHHTLPQFYLSGFTRGGMLWVFDRAKKQFRRQTPKNTAVESGFYSFATKDGGKSDAVENLLSRIEGSVKPALKRLADRQSISAEQRHTVALFAATLHLRTPGFRRMNDAMKEAMMKRVLQIALQDERVAEVQLRKAKTEVENPAEDVTARDIVEFAQQGKYSIQFAPEDSIRSMVTLAPGIASLLADLQWSVVHAPETKGFVTSDEPFVLLPPTHHKPGLYGIGLGTPGTTKLLPLNERVCLMMGDIAPGSTIRHGRASAEWVRTVNLNVTLNCERFVIGAIEALVRSVVKATGVERKPPRQRFQVG
jgi:uncharacterized protein DUF4238